jgi:transcriptional regulator with XRE-family HTH domain
MRVTQLQLAAALDVSPALISSWESAKSSAVPPTHRLEAYARFFATRRSVAGEQYRLLRLDELTAAENADREELLDELLALVAPEPAGRQPPGLPFDGTMFRYPADEDITIVCSELPQERRSKLSYAAPDSPDYIEAYKYADLDALLELHGHVRAANPLSRVNIRVAPLMADEYATHLVLLGGVDWNPVTRELMSRVDMPVRQSRRAEDETLGAFEVGPENDATVLTPSARMLGEQAVLTEDVAQIYRSVSPFNIKRTVTLCNGTHQPGTLGMVRALTDARFRDRNERFIRERFAGTDTFTLISRVSVINGVAITPDWSLPGDRLFEWSPGDDG